MGTSPFLSAIVMLLVLTATGCSSPAGEGVATPAVVRVQAVEAAPPEVLVFPGQVRSVSRSLVASQVAGVIEQVHVDRGARVSREQTLVTISHPGLTERSAAAQSHADAVAAERDQARLDLDRLDALLGRQLVARQERDRAKSRLDALTARWEQARGELQAARAIHAEQSLKAGHEGVVGQIHAEPGDFVAAGQPVVTLVGDSAWEVEISLPGRIATQLSPGTQVELRLPGHRAPVQARMREHGGRPGREGLVAVIFELDGPASEIDPGPAEVHVPMAPSEGVWVPLSALRNQAQAPGAAVLRLQDGSLEQVAVDMGHLSGAGVIVSGDLGVGDLLVVAGPPALQPGQAVQALENSP